MSTDLDLDAILAEFHEQESQPPRAETPRPARRRRDYSLLDSGELSTEETLLYEKSPARHAAPVSQAPAAPATVQKPATVQEPVRKPAPRAEAPASRLRPAPTPKPDRQAAPSRPPQAKERSEKVPAPAAKKRPSHGLGFALMFLVLLLLTAALAGLLRWNSLAEADSAPREPEPLRLELGAELERTLDESAGSTR